MPIISIIIVTLNNNPGLVDTLLSLEAYKNIPNFEILVIDGFSSDGSMETITSNSGLIARFISEPDFGIYDGMNKGIDISSGRWLWFLNAGDVAVVSPFTLLRIIKQAELKSSNFVYSDMRCGDVVIRQNLNYYLLSTGMINHQSIIYRSDLIGKYDLRYKSVSDYANLLMIFKKIQPFKTSFLLSNYDLNGISSIRTRLSSVKTWLYRMRAILMSDMPITFIVFASIIAICVVFIKLINPTIGSKVAGVKTYGKY